jgi:metal-responsive CopG/Arc/MetJ family transcriptional regulator
MSLHQSEKKSVKVQITLPEDIAKKIEEEVRESYSSKSYWFLKIVNEYFEQKEKKKKSVISLNIK